MANIRFPSDAPADAPSSGPVKNTEAERLPSDIGIDELASAMAELDIEAIPPHKRKAAIMDHLMMIMARSVKDPQKAREIEYARALRSNQRLERAIQQSSLLQPRGYSAEMLRKNAHFAALISGED